jgi:hypothetical protein
VGVAKNRTNLDKSQGQANQLEEKAETRPEQTPKKGQPREDFGQDAVRIVREATDRDTAPQHGQ